MASPATAVLIVHGSYFTTELWTSFSTLLETSGFTVSRPQLPSCGDKTRPPTATLADDGATVRAAAEELIAAGHKILILAHSYGGCAVGAGVSPELYASAPGNNGAGVVSIVYVAALMPLPGESVLDLRQRTQLKNKLERHDNGDGTVIVTNALEVFYNDLPREEGEKYASMRVPQNVVIALGKTQYAPWKDVKAVYVLCERDLSIFAETQEVFVKACNENGGNIETVRMDAGHCPWYAKGDELLRVIERVGDRGGV